jgi:hypothetical protein
MPYLTTSNLDGGHVGYVSYLPLLLSVGPQIDSDDIAACVPRSRLDVDNRTVCIGS